MISLVDLLLENINKPKAIFLAGPAGSGKSSFIKDNIPNLKVINIDDTRKTRLSLRQINRARKAGEFHKEEQSKELELVRTMYGAANQPEM